MYIFIYICVYIHVYREAGQNLCLRRVVRFRVNFFWGYRLLCNRDLCNISPKVRGHGCIRIACNVDLTYSLVAPMGELSPILCCFAWNIHLRTLTFGVERSGAMTKCVGSPKAEKEESTALRLWPHDVTVGARLLYKGYAP